MLKTHLQFIVALAVMSTLAFTVPASAKTLPSNLPPGAIPSTITKVKIYTKVKTTTKIVKDKYGHKKRVKVASKPTYKETTYECPPSFGFGKDHRYCLPSAPATDSQNNDAPSNAPVQPVLPVQPDMQPASPTPTTIIVYVPAPTPTIPDTPNNDVCGPVILVDPQTGENMSPCAPTNPRIKVCNPDGDSTPESKIPNCSDIFPFLTNGQPGGMK